MTARSSRARTLTPAGIARPGLLFLLAVTIGLCATLRPADASGKKGEIGIGVYFGGGSYDNTDFNRALVAAGYPPIESGIEYGFGVDYRLSKWFSLGASAARIGGDTSPKPGAAPATSGSYGVHGSPLIVSFITHAVRNPHGNLDVFVGAGPLLQATVSSSNGLEGHRTGTYFHAGGTFEARLSPMVAFSVSGLARRAQASNVDLRTISGDPNAKWDVKFNGAAFWVGPKLYFGAAP